QSGPRKRVKTERELGTPSSTRKTSAYDPAFEQHLIDYGIYPEGYNDDEGSEEPANIEDIHRRLAQPRPSLSPSRFTRKKFLDFRQKNRKALTENTVMSKVFPIIAGTAEIPSQENLYFGNLKDLTDGSITKAKPDFYDGSHPTELNAQIRKQLSEYIEPSTKKTVPLLPNFFAEGKGPDGNATVCKRQAVYDEALGARGIHQLRSYVDPKTAYDNNAYTIASTYHGGTGTLTMYTTHAAPPKDPGSSAEYHMTQLKAFAMTSDPETFRQGATFLRNARDLTHDERKELIAAANAKALYAKSLCFSSSTQSSMSHSSNEPTHPESETSPDEFALDLVTLDRPNHGTPISTRTKSPPHVATNQRLKRDYRSNKSI
ncbi:MAG: hypothetical protein LQ342_005851, partial [Letrouitia transgressa]